LGTQNFSRSLGGGFVHAAWAPAVTWIIGADSEGFYFSPCSPFSSFRMLFWEKPFSRASTLAFYFSATWLIPPPPLNRALSLSELWPSFFGIPFFFPSSGDAFLVKLFCNPPLGWGLTNPLFISPRGAFSLPLRDLPASLQASNVKVCWALSGTSLL